ncbi:unnamed protein product [Didymodactylos carnosus]|uniref:Phytanoyl-CoA dioxygenase n=1 Tax=Didymodactylos carnosus TaxID=1234261 RepID=A0A815NCQ3_9BILA|nr:unnamed protein product [Didymodactylos carnosus]CAF1436464.1 unnamed protein product [Didymodactylos carnosus]CAF4034886.1 unnamed protein product [Didymodactylos carnosus]CAF4313873.1 unnamed protein product [Didymodactylos carnosus]
MEIPQLLTDKQVQEFLINGYLVLDPVSLDSNFHSTIFTEVLSIFKTKQNEHNPGNNILPCIPQLQCVFNDPIIKGALQSLLGFNYTMQPHRNAHLTRPGTKDQLWHKDSYFGYTKPLRHHQLRYIMAMYYPQDTTIDMGPTAIKPRTQYDVMDPDHPNKTLDNSNSMNDERNDIYLICKAGTVVLIHYDIVHRRTRNTTERSNRFMFKFLFNRVEEPVIPTWNHNPTNDTYDAIDAGILQPVVKHVWDWMICRNVKPTESVSENDVTMWKSQLSNRNGKIRLNAAYNLGLCNEYNVLINRLYEHEEIFCLEAAYALTACKHDKNVVAKLQEILKKEENNERIAYCIAFILSEMGQTASDALPLLINIVQSSDSWLVKQYCCEALGTICSNGQQNIDLVIQCLTNILSNQSLDKNNKQADHARFTAALSLAKIGAMAAQAIPTLKNALYFDSNRYVIANALLALERIGTRDTLSIVLDYLKLSRWCPKTTASSPF